jgi:uncharacterized protein YbaR (Trm112 family)
MALSKELLNILVCPQCKGEVRLSKDGGALLCDRCRLAYPVMLIDEAEKISGE